MLLYNSLEEAFKNQLDLTLREGHTSDPRQKATIENLAVAFRINNPRARLIKSPERKWSIAYAIGELLWNLAASDDLEFISYYSRRWKKIISASDIVSGSCYGARIFSEQGGLSQWEQALNLVNEDVSTRRAVLSIINTSDLMSSIGNQDTPCTCTLQFIIREGAVNMISYMRSNDAMYGMCYDIFLFTMLQEIFASRLGISLGWYQHFAGSYHIYEYDKNWAKSIINESHSYSNNTMPNMTSLEELPQVLEYEKSIRTGSMTDPLSQFPVSKYWEELLLILLNFKLKRSNDLTNAETVKKRLTNSVYKDLL